MAPSLQRNGAAQPLAPAPLSAFVLYVGDLSPDVSDEALYQFFAQRYASCRSARVVADAALRSRGFGFVQFANADECLRALSEMQGKTGLGSSQLRLSMAMSKPCVFPSAIPPQPGPASPKTTVLTSTEPPNSSTKAATMAAATEPTCPVPMVSRLPMLLGPMNGLYECGNVPMLAASYASPPPVFSTSPVYGLYGLPHPMMGAPWYNAYGYPVGPMPFAYASPYPMPAMSTSYATEKAGDPNNVTVFVGGLSSLTSVEELCGCVMRRSAVSSCCSCAVSLATAHRSVVALVRNGCSLFAVHGEIAGVRIPPGKGCGFVEFTSRDGGERAIAELSGTVLRTCVRSSRNTPCATLNTPRCAPADVA